MSSFAKISIRFNADLKQFSTQMQSATRDMQKMGKQMTAVGKNLTLGLTAPIVGLGGLAVKTFMDFEQAMAKVKAISGATAAEFAALRKNAEDLGASTRFTASQVAELQLNFSKLGLKPDEILAATGATLDLALATGEDLAQSATVAASTVRGFGLAIDQTTRVTDVMAKSFSSSALDLEKFSTAMAVLAPVANVAGVSLERATGMLSVLVNAGIDASTAGTGLRNIFLDLADKGLTMEEALDKINTSTNRNKTSMELFGKRGATVATVLAANIVEADKLAVSYEGAAGAAAEMAAIMDNTLQGSMFAMQSALEGVAIAFGELIAPYVRQLAGFVASLAQRFKELEPATKKIIIVVAAFAAAIGPVLVTLGFLMTTVIPGLIALIPTLGVVFTALGGPIGLVVAAIAAIAFMVYKHWDSIKQEMVNLQNYFIDLYNESILFRAGIEQVVLAFKTLWNVVKLVFGSIWNIISGLAKYFVDSFKNVGAVIKAALTGDFEALPGILAKQMALMNKSFVTTFKDIGGEFSTFTDNMKRDFGSAIDNINQKKKIEFKKGNVDASGVTEAVNEALKTPPITPVIPGGEPTGRGTDFLNRINSIGKDMGLAPIQTSPFDIIAPKMKEQVEVMSEAMFNMKMNALAFNEGFTEIIQNTATNFLAGFGQILGAMAAGEVGMAALGNLIASSLGDMAIQIGKMAIGIGFAVIGIKKALQSLAGPVAIAAGLALVALGTLVKSTMGKMASGGSQNIPAFANGGMVYGPTLGLMGEYAGAANNPEVIAPLDKLQKYISDAVGTPGGAAPVELKLRGQDFILMLDRATAYKNRRR